MEKSAIVRKIMTEFAERTCLSGEGCTPVRYLWTDAFAVCNFLALYEQTGEENYKESALALVDQVHHVLGKHRDDDPRSGWISGLDEEEGEKHPTAGGLRIGKKQNERKQDAPYDERLEWEQDGQYFHYLTKWMHALNRVTEVTGDPRYNFWARELAKTAYAGFVHTLPGNRGKRMVWKMSIDLSYPLVPSMGQHDALDGYITYLELETTAAEDPDLPYTPQLDTEITEMLRMCQSIRLETDDPLGIGGLLSDACKLARLKIAGDTSQPDNMLPDILTASKKGVDAFLHTDLLKYPPEYRLAFRELGLAIGLRTLETIRALTGEYASYFSNRTLLESQLAELMPYQQLAELIEDFWLLPENQTGSTWQEHIDINSVMLATSLLTDTTRQCS